MTIFSPYLRLIDKGHDVEVNVGAAVAHEARALNGEDGLAALILHEEAGLAECPLLLQGSNHLTIIIIIMS